MATSSRRRWDRDVDDDPLGGLVNLFDLWIVVVVALTLALAGRSSSSSGSPAESADAGTPTSTEVPAERQIAMPKFRPSDSTLTGQGQRLGTAYRLSSGEVVYVPEAPEKKGP